MPVVPPSRVFFFKILMGRGELKMFSPHWSLSGKLPDWGGGWVGTWGKFPQKPEVFPK